MINNSTPSESRIKTYAPPIEEKPIEEIKPIIEEPIKKVEVIVEEQPIVVPQPVEVIIEEKSIEENLNRLPSFTNKKK
jgi:hypothetical protein